MEALKRQEVLKQMSKISELVNSSLERNQSMQNITYYQTFDIGNSGFAQEEVYVVKITDKDRRKIGENIHERQEDITYKIYDKNNNLIANVDEQGKIHFDEEYRMQIERIYGEYASELNLDNAELEEIKELSNKDLVQSKEELTEYKEKEQTSRAIETDRSKNEPKEEEKEQSPEQETEEEKKEKTAQTLGIKPEDIKSICRLNPNQRVSETETIRDIIPEASQYKELQISCTNPTERNSGIFTIIGVKENGEREILNSIEPIEGTSSNKEVISISEDGSTVQEKQVKGLFQINSGNRTNGIAVSVGSYGMMDIDYIQNVRDKETRRAIPIRTMDSENQKILSREMEEQARDTVNEVKKEGENFRKDEIKPKSMDGIDVDEADGKMSLDDLKEKIKDEALEKGDMNLSELQEFIKEEIENEGLELTDEEEENTIKEISEDVIDESRFPSRDEHYPY